MKSFDGKVAAITGAGSGIGRALALELAKKRCDLALSDVDEAGVADTADQAEAQGVKVTSAKVDVSDRSAVFAWADQVVADHGRVNLIFNNAGVAMAGPVAETTIEQYEWIVGINWWGVVYGTKAFLPHLEASGEGHVINVSSISGLLAQPLMSGYNATKFAVRGFTEGLRLDLELADSCVSATSVHPGGIKTDIVQRAKHAGDAEQLLGMSRDEATALFEKSLITSAEKAAKIILRAVRRNRRRVLVGPDAVAYDSAVRLLPAGYQRLFGALVKRQKRNH